MKLDIVKQDLFTIDPEYSKVQCISADLAMGKGIALEFNKRYNTKRLLKNKFPKGYLNENGYYQKYGCLYEEEHDIFNLVTKCRYYDKPNYITISGALYALKFQCGEKGITKLAMPKIGCGLDRMSWEEVESAIKSVFEDTDIEIIVCVLEE